MGSIYERLESSDGSAPYMPSAKTWDINPGVCDDMGYRWVDMMDPNSINPPLQCNFDFHPPIPDSDRNKAETLVSWDMMVSDRKKAKTMVWWDINACPVPDGYDARLVRPSIERALKKSGYCGPVTITAIGNLKRTSKQSPDVLREIYSTGGIILEHRNLANLPSKNLHRHLDFGNVLPYVFDWTLDNPPPASLMLIFRDMVSLSPSLDLLLNCGYSILLAHPRQHPRQRSPTLLWPMEGPPTEEWLWESLLEDSMDPQDLQLKCTETHESHWVCSLCNCSGQCFEELTTHLMTCVHALISFDLVTGADHYQQEEDVELERRKIEDAWDRMSL